MDNDNFVEMTPPNGNSPLPINEYLTYKTVGETDLNITFYTEGDTSKPYTTETFRFDTPEKRKTFVNELSARRNT